MGRNTPLEIGDRIETDDGELGRLRSICESLCIVEMESGEWRKLNASDVYPAPSPSEIAAMCEAMQAKWTNRQRIAASCYPVLPVEIYELHGVLTEEWSL